MANALSVFHAFRSAQHQERAWLGWRENFITLLAGFWLMVGLFVDGWAHNNLRELETFFTPWHAIFYSGFLANLLWLSWLIFKQWRTGRTGIAAIPRGYHLGVLGLVIFGLGGFGDMLWHIIFGVEESIEALLSPTHLLLFLGGSLIFASPFLAAWQSPKAADNAPSFWSFLPALGSLTMMTSFAAFMHMYLWAFLRDFHTQQFFDRMTDRYSSAIDPITRLSANAGLQGILITNIILLAPVLLMLRRWQPPFGAVTFLFTLNTVLMSALEAFRPINIIIIALIAGLCADGLIQVLRPWPQRLAAYRAVAMIIPLVLWSLYFVADAMEARLAWPLELTAGIVVMAALSGLALSLLMVPPPLPSQTENS